MTQAEKIEKLAKWMGWRNWPGGVKSCCDLPASDHLYFRLVESKIGHPITCVTTESKENISRSWDPFTSIADAWMLVERACALSLTAKVGGKEWDKLFGFMETLRQTNWFHLTVSEAAAAITNAVLEVLDA